MKKYSLFWVCCLMAIFSATGIHAQRSGESNSIPSITGERAAQIALERSSGGTIYKIDWEMKRYGSRYDVEIIRDGLRFEIKLDGDTGEIFSYRERRHSSREPQMPPQNQITFERAREIALSNMPGGVVTEIDWRHRNGRFVYEIELRQGGRKSKIQLDAVTGERLMSGRRR